MLFVLLQIVEGEVDPQLKQQACEQLTSGVCQLLLWLTACWQPPGWPLAWQSLALPPAVAGGCTQAGGAGGDGVVVDAAASAPVGQLLRVVAGCGVHSWEDLQQVSACVKGLQPAGYSVPVRSLLQGNRSLHRNMALTFYV